MTITSQKTALITGASKGLGYYLAENLARQGWNLVINARELKELGVAKRRLSKFSEVVAIPGDVRDEVHLLEFAGLLKRKQWRLSLVVNNASTLGVSPLQPLLEHPVANLHMVFHTNMIAPISLLQKVSPYLLEGATIINITSDAGREPYETWGAYGGSKAGLEQMTVIIGMENPHLYCYAFDPGDMRTDMHQAAFPHEDISDRPLPTEHAVPAIMQLVKGDLPSGRYDIQSVQAQMV